MHIEDTIAAIATPLGQGGLGVVRISGPQALPLTSRLFFSPQPKDFSQAATHTLHHGWIKIGDRIVDEAMAGVFRGPRSYTGEDVVELSCHGSPAILKEVLTLCLSHGARLARPGEFTLRAYLNGKMDLPQAEAVAELVQAHSQAAVNAAQDQLRGLLSQRIRKIRQDIVELAAHIEANLDFAEEDIPDMPRQKIGTALDAVIEELQRLLSTSLRGKILREGLRIPLVGRPNVGKSCLFNALLAQDRAIVTDIPGTTRDTLEERIEWEGLPIVLIDTAGLRDTQDPVEQQGVERTRQAHKRADLTLWVLEANSPLLPDDETIARHLDKANTIAVLNKQDQGLRLSGMEIERRFGVQAVVPVSARQSTGLSDLKTAVVKMIEQKAPTGPEGAPVVTNIRHVNHLEKTSAHLRRAREAYLDHRTEESLAADLHEALEELGQITGESVTEDILSAIFSTFCIGK